ncbi:hypothetical protein L5I01_30070 [Gordonia sp. HY442]|uniref:hypothetical protein n=1 Tax=Gordonia zhenghanii TaxID=2911516 RepID=UPI001F262407|nr:hypothetical protein [Gordonia zhenghanii]MCF8607611.1 hypothetical protein [Gordonia zhenghanii]
MARFYVLDVPENEGVVRVVSQTIGVEVARVGPYYRITGDDEVEVDRRATGVRHAVWYSSIAGLEGSMIVQHDKDALRVVTR